MTINYILEVNDVHIEDYKKVIRPMLNESRYQHCLNVAKCAKELARKYGADENKAEITGLLHDIMKNTAIEEQIKILDDFGLNTDKIGFNEIDVETAKLWHAKTGAAYLQYKLRIDDSDILNAVRYHTTARKNMSKLEKVIFVADFISDDRDYDGVEEIRQAAQISLETAMIEGLSFTICDLSSRKMPIHKDTIEAYNELIMKEKSDS